MKSEVIVSTYNKPSTLLLTLDALAMQTVLPDLVTVADDGSEAPTQSAVDAYRQMEPPFEMRHVWQCDYGFRKNTILNKAIAQSDADYLIFVDGDCLLHSGFVSRHLARARRGQFLCGSVIRLGAKSSSRVLGGDIDPSRFFDRAWLRAEGEMDRFATWLKTAPMPGAVMGAFEREWPARKSWIGSNSSAFREDILSVNGFDEAMSYGGEDKEFGVRLANKGVRGRTLRFSAPVVHLDHPREYADAEEMRANRAKIQHARRSKKTWTEAGLIQARIAKA